MQIETGQESGSRPTQYAYWGTPPSRQQRQAGRGAGWRLNPQRLATGLGWFSIGLGVAQILAPRQMSRLAGLPRQEALMRGVGIREIATGLGILTQQRSRDRWLWSRVGGDAMDLALLGMALRGGAARPNRALAATAAVAAMTALDVFSSRQATREAGTREVRVEQSVVINRSPEECYGFWRSLDNLPRFMEHVESVRVLSDTRSQWTVKAPGGKTVQWESEITDDEPGQRLAWRSIPGGDVDNSGEVRFEPASGRRGTIVRVLLQYRPPAGETGRLAARLLGEEPKQQVHEDLRHFKQILETGEIPTTVGQPSGRRGLVSRFLLRKGAPG